MDYDAFLALVKKRRSIRRFKPDPVPDEYIDKIVEAARWAPSSANSQPWEFIIIKEKETRDKIVDLIDATKEETYRMEQTREERLRHPGGRSAAPEEALRQAPVLIVVLGDPRMKEASILTAVHNHGDANLNTSLANAFIYMHLAAASLGLGSRYVSSTSSPFVQALMKDLLGIPKQLEIYDTIALGFRAGEPRPRLVREKSELVHRGRYDRSKFRTDKEAEDFIASIHRDRITPGGPA
ncbi:MAG: nitroreductase [Dehalococcoidia bacterium]|nr:nitroreductase [Dehalococcoidia bacterium]